MGAQSETMLSLLTFISLVAIAVPENIGIRVLLSVTTYFGALRSLKSPGTKLYRSIINVLVHAPFPSHCSAGSTFQKPQFQHVISLLRTNR